MHKFRFKPVAAVLFALGFSASNSAYAICDGCVVGAVETANLSITMAVNGVTASVTAMNTSLNTMLYQVGTAVTQGSNKVANTVETSARVQREFDANLEKNRRYEDARQRYSVPDSICSESASGGAAQVRNSVAAIKASLRSGGGSAASDSKVAQALNSPAQTVEVDALRSASIHASYCDADDYAAYGGAAACPQVSATMPGADKRMDSLTIGAGPNGKTPDLTFSKAQTDAARMYTQNSGRRSVGPQLKKGQASTDAGSRYVGLMNQFLAIISAATDPQEQMIADSQPNEATKSLLAEARQSPSAESYYQQTASDNAKSSGQMSAREFEQFEVGRRYANTEYQADLQKMEGDNLLREQVRALSLNNWLMLEIKNELSRSNVINGMHLASTARQEFEPMFTSIYRDVSGSMGGSK